MKKSDINKLEAFKEFFDFISIDQGIIDNLLSLSIDEAEKKYGFDDDKTYKYALMVFKHRLKEELNKEYRNDRIELFRRLFDIKFSDSSISYIKKLEILSATVKAINLPIKKDFYKELLNMSSDLRKTLRTVMVCDKNGALDISSDMKDSLRPILPIFEEYFGIIDLSHHPRIKKVNDGDGLLSKKEERDLFIRFRKGDRDAYSKIIEKNQGLINSVIMTHYSWTGLDYNDLLQQGNLGLIRAAKDFDPDTGNAFSTYATNWIRQTIRRYISDNFGSIRVPYNKREKLNRISSKVRKLIQEYGRELTHEELISELQLSEYELLEYINLTSPVMSLNRKVSVERNHSKYNFSELQDFIVDDEIPYESLLEDMSTEGMLNIIRRTLNDKEYDIFCRRNGIGYRPHSLEEIGEKFSCSRERIRQLESKAIEKLRSNKDLLKYRKNVTLFEGKLEQACADNIEALNYIKHRLGIYDGVKKTHDQIGRKMGKKVKPLIRIRDEALSILNEDEELKKYVSFVDDNRVVKEILGSRYSKEDVEKVLPYLTSKDIEVIYDYYLSLKKLEKDPLKLKLAKLVVRCKVPRKISLVKGTLNDNNDQKVYRLKRDC